MSAFSVGDEVRHVESGWAGPVIKVDVSGIEELVTVRPTHPRPKQVLGDGGFVPTPDDWPGWRPLTVTAAELEKT